MVLADYHVHSLSPDARVPMDDMCDAAIASGLTEIAITDHMEMFSPNYNSKETLFFASEEFVCRYFKELERCREKYSGRLTLRAGVELGQPAVNPEFASCCVLTYPFDFVLGSIHKLHDVDLGYKVYTPQTTPGLCVYNLELLYELADSGDFDIVAHIDLIRRYAARQGQDVSLMEHREALERILRRLVERGKGIEINTSGLRQGLGATMPRLDILKLFCELGGELVTLGSDAHRAEDVGANLADAAELAREAGFRYSATFEKRVASFHAL